MRCTRHTPPLVILIIVFIVTTINTSAAQTEPITSLRCNQFTFDATGSHDPDNEEITFFWNFGDGHTSTEPIVNHTYEQAGKYEVSLKITDNSGLECSTAVQTQLVMANIRPQATFSAAETACTGELVTFDASLSQTDQRSGLNYIWRFGDGTKTEGEKRISKSYTSGGDYNVSLTVDDQLKSTCSTQTTEKLIHINEPPKAEAGEDTILRCVDSDDDLIVEFDGTHSSDANNDALSYEWDFGDGQIESGQKVSHRYADIDNYDVKLVVKDDSQLQCNTSVDFVSVRFNKAPKADAGQDAVTCVGQEVLFDGSNSYVHKKGTASTKWFFGDGQSDNGFKVGHRYSKPGKYQASLQIENQLNEMCPPSRDTRNVTVNSTPTVEIKAVESVCLGNKVLFDASSANDADGDSLEYYWTFGDGTILRGSAKVEHQYQQGGNYRVNVIVDDGKETSCSTASAMKNIRVNTPPLANAGPNLSCCVDTEVTFNASASSDPDGDQLTFAWDFGDGATEHGPVTYHTYDKSGSFNVTVTVDDNAGTTCSKSTSGFTAVVNSTPVPVINVR